ncbi:hypothetical protein ACIQ1D_18975 [Lysinibacillus xylanilyticus]|uniref:hypothetical protein n=1 Tax=Lysinibacillus xylanilyticus TaxID=582475 RepID=UPI00381A58A9
MFYTWNDKKYFGRMDVCKLLDCENDEVRVAHNKLLKKGILEENKHFWVLGIKDELEFKKQNVDSVFVPRLYLYSEDAIIPLAVQILKRKKPLYSWEGQNYFTHSHIVEWFGMDERNARDLKKKCGLLEEDFVILQDNDYTEFAKANNFNKSGHLIYIYKPIAFLKAIKKIKPEINSFLSLNTPEIF